MNARTTDWALATLTAFAFTTGILTLISGRTSDQWVFFLHAIIGTALGFVSGWKVRRVWRRLVMPRLWKVSTLAGAGATAFVFITLCSGWVWSFGGNLVVAGFNLLNWHIALGITLTAMVSIHGLMRAKPLLRRDLASRRQALHLAGIVGAATTAWMLQRPTTALLGWRGANRRWSGSYEQGSFSGNAFPATSWIADRPIPLNHTTYRLEIDGLVSTPLQLGLNELDTTDHARATLDCTGGFFSTQDWHGVRMDKLIARAQPTASATHVVVTSRTGYRWGFPLDEASTLLLATSVGNTPLSHNHGAPVRLVAPNRRGFQWIKWVVRLELHDGPDFGAAASTVWSSWTPAGRGES